MSQKTEKATPWALKKAREKGDVSKSHELTICMAMLTFLCVFAALGHESFLQIKQLLIHLFTLINHLVFRIDEVSQLQRILLSKLTLLWLPIALAGMLSIILSTLAQTGLVWSTKPLTPDFNRLNITKGFKRLFSTNVLFNAGKNSIKLCLVSLLIYISLKHELAYIVLFMKTNPAYFSSLLIHLISKIALQLLALLLTLALIDKLYTRWKYEKDHRMSKQELKDEYRQHEGDPKIKLKMKQLQHQLRQKTASLAHIKTADVVITNPTHLAIVLKYERGVMPAPKVVCKAQGELVHQVKSLATRHNIPIIENKPLARLLFATSELNQWIEREHFPLVAAIFRDLYHQKAMA